MGKVTYINKEGQVTSVLDDAPRPSTKAMQEYFDGAYAEHVTVLHNGRRASLYVHEMGLYVYNERNPTATDIYFAASRARGIDPDTEAGKAAARKEVEAMATRMGIPVKNVVTVGPTAKAPGIYGPAILCEGHFLEDWT